jgi:hypothetical protein
MINSTSLNEAHYAAQETMNKSVAAAVFKKPIIIIIVGPTDTKWGCNTLALPVLIAKQDTTQQPPSPTSWAETHGDLSSFDEGGRLR